MQSETLFRGKILIVPHHLFTASVCSDGCEGEDAVVQGRRVVMVLQDSTEQLEQLAVVRLERFRVGLNNLVKEQEANLERRPALLFQTLLRRGNTL